MEMKKKYQYNTQTAFAGSDSTMKVKEMAKELGIGLITAYELTKRKDFPSIRIGNRIIIPKEAFYKWLNEAAVKGDALNV